MFNNLHCGIPDHWHYQPQVAMLWIS